MNINIRQLSAHENPPMELLLLADPSQKLIVYDEWNTEGVIGAMKFVPEKRFEATKKWPFSIKRITTILSSVLSHVRA